MRREPVCSTCGQRSCKKQKLDGLLSEARWRRALRFTECIAGGCVFIGFAVVNEPSLSMPLVLAGAITLTLSRVTSKVP